MMPFDIALLCERVEEPTVETTRATASQEVD
jgi:hypothetical protein